MSKKKHPEHVNHERWLVSYADFITLLFAFFVVLFASGQSDKRKTVALAHSMQSAFDHNGIFDPHSRTPPITENPNAIKDAVPLPLTLPLPSLQTHDAEASAKHAEERIREVVKQQQAAGKAGASSISIHSTTEGLVISLRESGFFHSGSAEVEPAAESLVRALAAELSVGPMRVEGHTDNVPIHTAEFASNWELSTARAAAITRLLLSLGAASPTLTAATGYAEFRPLADNSTEAGRTANRRVDIVLLKPTPEPAASAPKGNVLPTTDIIPRHPPAPH